MTVSTILAEKGRDVVTIEPNATLAEAAKLLADQRIGATLVLGADQRISGIIIAELGHHRTSSGRRARMRVRRNQVARI